MANALYTKSLPISKTILHMPDINEVVEVLSNGLKTNFAEVSVDYVDCPDLKKEPFYLASSGLGGNPHLLDIGGVPYLLPLVNREKIYNLADMCNILKVEPGFMIGAGAGPWPYLGVNCEGVINLRVENGKVDQQTRIASISPTNAEKGTGSCKLEVLPMNETRSALLVNLLLSQGKPGKVFRVVCKKRTGSLDYIAAIRQCLANKYADKCIGLGGAFVLKEGKAKHHVMPDFSKIALNSNADVEDWLHFFDMSAPMVNLGTLVSHDPGLDLRLQHFHGFSQHGEGGHYHIDTTPDAAYYIGYFTLAEVLVRVDRPPENLDFGQD